MFSTCEGILLQDTNTDAHVPARGLGPHSSAPVIPGLPFRQALPTLPLPFALKAKFPPSSFVERMSLTLAFSDVSSPLAGVSQKLSYQVVQISGCHLVGGTCWASPQLLFHSHQGVFAGGYNDERTGFEIWVIYNLTSVKESRLHFVSELRIAIGVLLFVGIPIRKIARPYILVFL